MTNNLDSKFEIRVRSRGGIGNNATWLWEVLEGTGGLPLKKGTVMGAEKKAYAAANQEVERLTAARAKA